MNFQGQMTWTAANACTDQLRIKNSHVQPLRLHIEPWAEEVLILPNVLYQIVAEGPRGDHLELEFAEGKITIYGWPGSVLSVFQGQQAICQCLIPAPPLPRSNREK